MPYKQPKIEKVVFSIGEVASMLEVNTSLIRYWSNQFEIKPRTNKKNNRLFSNEDIATLKLIYHLVKERGMTIKGAKQKLKDNKKETEDNFQVVDRLKNIRHQLIEIRDALDDEYDQT